MTPETLSEHELAAQWRKKHGLSRRQVSELTGWSVSAIQDIERGFNSGGAPVSGNSVKRYKLACAAITYRQKFNWDRAPV